MMRVYRIVWVFLFAFFGCDDSPPPDATKPLGSRVELAAGDVFLTGEETKERLITGAMLPADASVSVGEGGRALLRLGTGTGTFLRGGSDITISGGSIDLKQGELWADVPAAERDIGRFKAGRVTVTASDAGFDVRREKNEVSVYVARGFAVVSSPGGRVELHSGERAVVKGESKPEVGPVSFFEDWTGGMADRELLAGIGGKGSGRIYGIDRARPGSKPKELQINSQSVRIAIRDGIAHTVVDQRFFNPSSTPLEGWYWFTVPEGASVERFALEVHGSLVDGEMIERKQAAAAYEEAVQKAFDPALLEWVDGRTFRARIYPIPPIGDRRVVLSYTEMLPLVDGVYRYVYPMGGHDEAPIAEFSLDVNLGDEGEDLDISTLQEARVDKDKTHISMRRSGFVPRSDFLLELTPKETPVPLRTLRISLKEDEADYVMVRYSPDVDWDQLDRVPGDVVVVLDTSAGGDDSDRQVRSDAVEAILRALSSDDRFAVVAADLIPRAVYPAEGLAKADEKNVSEAVEKLAEVASAGATDLGEMFSVAFDLLHAAEQPAVVYVGDGLATVGETSPTEVSQRLRRALGDSKVRLFTIGVGEDANHSLLDRLARVGGGRSFRIDTAEQTVQEALRFVGQVKTPTVTELKIDAGNGLDQVFSTASGKLSEGDEVILTARTHNTLPSSITVTGRLGGKPFKNVYDTDVEKGEELGYIPVLWARQYLDRLSGDGLEDNRGRIISLGLGYSLMTPFTSFLVLESDRAYEEQGIKRKKRYRKWTRILDGDGDAKVASLNGVAGIPLSLFGCSDKKEAEVEVQQDEVPEWLKKDRRDERQGGKGKRHKSEEGQMGKKSAAKTDNHYGIRGPKDNSSPHLARSIAKEGAVSQGVESALGDLMGNGTAGKFGYGGLGIRGTGRGGGGTGRGGGGTGEGTIGLGNLNTIGHGGGGGSGSGYGRGAGGVGGKRGSAPRIRSGAAMVKGSLSKEVIRRIVHRHINEVKFCYERQLAKRPDLSGRVAVKFIISATGAVQMAAVANSTLGDPQVENCISKAVRRWTFPQPGGGGIVIVTYPFMLTCEGCEISAEAQRAAEQERAEQERAEQERAEQASMTRTKRLGKGLFGSGVCSDASRRPLSQRRILWLRKLSRVTKADQYARIFFEAGTRCELPRWRDRRVLLDLIEGRIRDPESVRGLLESFGNFPRLQKHLRRKILRRALDPSLTMGLHFPGGVNWGAVLAGLAALKTPEARVDKLRTILEKHPTDPMGRGILVKLLFEASMAEEAMAEAKRLRRDGLASPVVLETLCDLQASAKLVGDAKRTCSEMVEFNASKPSARGRLGDLFLRHGWYEAAYRQYHTLVAMLEESAVSLLHLAAAAAGMGKVDEALRIERKVASGDGEPGPNDPRRVARLHSAARLARLLVDAREAKQKDKARALERGLKRTQVLAGETTIALLVWEDYEAMLELNPVVDDDTYPVSDRVLSSETGLFMIDLGRTPPKNLKMLVEMKENKLHRPVTYSLIEISWDGKTFQINLTQDQICRGESCIRPESG
ncbi:MAG: AgmX/PglI C-terminal domain-containing protein [Deltaproteobacteria bacterium]|nr:AgmX/PglI C-terminal domain-containing protein [Deltaproteobacteria bacterium]